MRGSLIFRTKSRLISLRSLSHLKVWACATFTSDPVGSVHTISTNHNIRVPFIRMRTWYSLPTSTQACASTTSRTKERLGGGVFLPPGPVERRGLLPATGLVTQSADVLVDKRGIYSSLIRYQNKESETDPFDHLNSPASKPKMETGVPVSWTDSKAIPTFRSSNWAEGSRWSSACKSNCGSLDVID